MPIELRRENWEQIWADAEPLQRQHAAEIGLTTVAGYRYRLDTAAMAQLADAGVLWCWAARAEAGGLLGYMTWGVTADIESTGTICATQNAWYVAPGKPILAMKLLKHCVNELRRAGVSTLFLHHYLAGRGAIAAPRMFKKLGAQEIKHEYRLVIGG